MYLQEMYVELRHTTVNYVSMLLTAEVALDYEVVGAGKFVRDCDSTQKC